MKDIKFYNSLRITKDKDRGFKTLYNVRSIGLESKEKQDDISAIVKLFKYDKPAVIIFNIPSEDDLFIPYHPIKKEDWLNYYKQCTTSAISGSYRNYILDNDYSNDRMLIYHVGENVK